MKIKNSSMSGGVCTTITGKDGVTYNNGGVVAGSRDVDMPIKGVKLRTGGSLREVIDILPDEVPKHLQQFLMRRFNGICGNHDMNDPNVQIIERLIRKGPLDSGNYDLRNPNVQFIGRPSQRFNGCMSPVEFASAVEHNLSRDQAIEERVRSINMEHWLMSHSPYMPDAMYRKLALRYAGENEVRMSNESILKGEFLEMYRYIMKVTCPPMVIASEPPVLHDMQFNEATVAIRKVEYNPGEEWNFTPLCQLMKSKRNYISRVAKPTCVGFFDYMKNAEIGEL